jgi:hypothetical protein
MNNADLSQHLDGIMALFINTAPLPHKENGVVSCNSIEVASS